MIYGNTGSSRAQKAVMVAAQTIVFAAALWLLLAGGLEWLSRLLHLAWSAASGGRRLILAAALAVVYVRISITGFYLLKRAIGWAEAATVPIGFALYYIGFPLFAGPVARPLGPAAYVGMALFLVGSYLNTGSEFERDRFKRQPANRGHLFTGGLFRLAVHINYFGDLLWVAGLALITSNPWSAALPLILFCFFAFYNAPLLDRHLAEKYGEEFAAYRRSTKRLIPFLF